MNKTIYFWGTSGPVGCFSNWYNSPFKYGGVDFCHVEQYMMYIKAVTFNDTETAQKVMATTDPRECKKLGRQVKNFDNNLWDIERYNVVAHACECKFRQNPDILKILLDTGNAELVEASPYDRVWGIGFNEQDAEANRDRWGANLLGRALMEVRDELRPR